MKKIIFTVCLLFLLGQKFTFAQKSTARFLLWRPSAESMSMGGTGVAQQLDGFSMYYNPASLTGIKTVDMVYSFYRPFSVFEDLVYHYGAAAVNLNKIGTFALSCEVYQKSVQLWTDETGVELGIDDQSSSRYKFTYALDVNSWFSFGVSLGYFKYTLSKVRVGSKNRKASANVFTTDAGIMFKNLWPDLSITYNKLSWLSFLSEDQDRGVNIAISVLNLGQKIQMFDDEQADHLPSMVSLGLSYRLIKSDVASFKLVSDFEKQIYEKSFIDFIRIGGEVRLLKVLALRGGYIKDTFESETSFATWGIGVLTQYVSYNLAYYNPIFKATWHHEFKLQMEF